MSSYLGGNQFTQVYRNVFAKRKTQAPAVNSNRPFAIKPGLATMQKLQAEAASAGTNVGAIARQYQTSNVQDAIASAKAKVPSFFQRWFR